MLFSNKISNSNSNPFSSRKSCTVLTVRNVLKWRHYQTYWYSKATFYFMCIPSLPKCKYFLPSVSQPAYDWRLPVALSRWPREHCTEPRADGLGASATASAASRARSTSPTQTDSALEEMNKYTLSRELVS